MAIPEIITLVGGPVVRSLLGWGTKAFADNKVTKLEWKLLVSTILRVGIIELALFYGAAGLGVDISAMGAAAGAIIADKLFNSLKTRK